MIRCCMLGTGRRVVSVQCGGRGCNGAAMDAGWSHGQSLGGILLGLGNSNGAGRCVIALQKVMVHAVLPVHAFTPRAHGCL